MEQVLNAIDLEALMTRLIDFIPKVVAAVLVLAAFWVGFRVVRTPIRAMLERAAFHQTLIDLTVDRVFKVTVYVIAAIMAVSQLGINVGAAVAGVGVAGIGVGFAAQDSIANFIAGFLILWDKPFMPGDHVTVAEQYGRVTDITLRTTRIRTPDNTYVVIPNKTIIDSILTNHTKEGELRLNVPIGIAYKEHIPRAREVLLEAVGQIPEVLQDPEPDVVVKETGASSVDLLVRVWIGDAADERPVFFHTLETCKLALDEAGIEIPFHHLQLFIEDVRERVWESARGLTDEAA